MWTRHEHHGGEYTGPAAALIRPVYRIPADPDGKRPRLPVRAESLNWPHAGSPDDILSYSVWQSNFGARGRHALPPEGWFVLRCLTGSEFAADAELRGLGIKTWAPTYRTLSKPRKKRKPVETARPLLPGYILAWVQPEQWPAICTSRQVIAWVADDHGPLPIRMVRQLDAIMERVALGEFDNTGLGPNIKIGTLLEVLFGAFVGQQIKFMGVKGNKIVGEVDMLGGPRSVLLNPLHLNTKG